MGFRLPRIWRAALPLMAVLAAVLALYTWRSRSALDLPHASPARATVGGAEGPTIAVLPFVSGSPDPRDEYFSDGLTEELISALSAMEALRVLGRTSSFAFKDSVQDARRIGRELGVKHLLEGMVRRSGGQLRIDARLIDATTGYGVWSETYDRRLEDALEIQADIARAIAGAIGVQLLDEVASGAMLAGRSTNPVAYDHYLQGLHFSHLPTEEAARTSIGHFRRAIDADPKFALAYAGLAEAYHSLTNRFRVAPPELMAEAETAAETAIELDESLAESHLALAVIKTWWQRDWGGAEVEFRRAIELKPSYAAAWQEFGWYLMAMHRSDSAVAAMRQALSLDPLSGLYRADLAGLLLYAHRYQEAIDEARLALDMDPANTRAWLIMGRAYSTLGKHREAFAAFREAESQPGQTSRRLTYFGHALAIAGHRAQAQTILDRVDSLARYENVPSTHWAALELALGYRERALARIERAEREGTLEVVQFQRDERLDPLRSDPRFVRVVARMGVPRS